jgi:hypothetical protein
MASKMKSETAETIRNFANSFAEHRNRNYRNTHSIECVFGFGCCACFRLAVGIRERAWTSTVSRDCHIASRYMFFMPLLAHTWPVRCARYYHQGEVSTPPRPSLAGITLPRSTPRCGRH